MGLHKGIDYIDLKPKEAQRAREKPSWKARYPNNADFNFNYWRLLDDARESAIGENKNSDLKIAIIGAGVAGLTAARELFRCGYRNIHIYEASERLGGRTYSKPIPGRYTTYEMGAMRMPYFDELGSENSVLDYYTSLFDIKTQDFPNPGSTVADTGIYLNDGFGPAPADKPLPSPQLLIWNKSDTNPPIKVGEWESKALLKVYEKWAHFAEMFTNEVKNIYGTPDWESFWQEVVKRYWDVNFRDFVYQQKLDKYEPSDRGNFGGLGMNKKEATLFYTIGAGDGSWGAFYDISCLYPIRTLLFGFGAKHQLIKGLFDDEGKFAGGPQCQQKLKDSLNTEFDGPNYLGVQTFADCLFFQPVKSPFVPKISLYDAMVSEDLGVKLFIQNPVTKLKKLANGRIKVNSQKVAEDYAEDYDILIPTLSTWAGQLSIEIEGFQPGSETGSELSEWPFIVTQSFKFPHWITSCKVFYPLKERYWAEEEKEKKEKPIPQLLSTDTLLQGVYGYALEDTAYSEAGVLLVSYTWEDDANKFLASQDDEKLARQLLDKLDDILCNCTNIGVPISPYVDTSQPTVIQWAKQPSYRGCAKLYREMTWDENHVLLTYNQQRSKVSNIYFAGEAFSVTGGWTEPAFRGALDAVIHVIHNTGGEFLNKFQFTDYPKHEDWSPSEEQNWQLLKLSLY